MVPHTKIHRLGLVIVTCSLVVSLVQAQVTDNRWVYIASGENGLKGYLENTYKVLNNGNKVIWAKYMNKDGTYDLYLMEYDCAQGKHRTTYLIAYNRTGTVTGSQEYSYTILEPPVPDSIGEALFDKVCEVKRHNIPSTRSPNYRTPEPKRNIPEKQDIGVDYAIVTVTRANLRENADVDSSAIIEISKGDLVVLLDRSPVGSWYNVIHVKSNKEGWVHGSTILTYYTKNRKPNLTIPGRSTGSYKNPTLEVKNDSNKTMTLKLREARYVFSPQESKTIPLTAGRYSFHASAPNVIPDFGEQNFELGYVYSWRFYIVTVMR